MECQSFDAAIHFHINFIYIYINRVEVSYGAAGHLDQFQPLPVVLLVFRYFFPHPISSIYTIYINGCLYYFYLAI
jgi:hypothetical protein